MDELLIEFQDKDSLHSDYDWANISLGANRVGKARCKIEADTLIIYSINIYPEYAGHGYGTSFVEEAKKKFSRIVADRVRFTAVGFWDKVGFYDNKDGNWVYEQ